jgi:DNA polymerase-4/protein ImuB
MVFDTSPDMRDVSPGMPLQEALARCKDAVIIEANVPSYERVFEQTLLRLGNWSPVVEGADLGCAYVGLDGLQETFGTEDRLIDALLHSVPDHLEPRLGISQGKFPAYLAAMKAPPGRVYMPPQALPEFLAQFPVEVLPVPWDVKTHLRSFGLETLGQVARLPVGPIQAQFGPTGARLWRLSQGIDDTPLLARRHDEEVSEWMSFPVPTANLGPLLMTVDHLLGRLFSRPEMRGRYTRKALISGSVFNRAPWQHDVLFKSPVGDRARAYFVIKSRLEYHTLPGPLEDVRITFKNLTGEVGRQESLFHDLRRRDQLRDTVAQLEAAYGHNPIYQVREVEPWSRIPERRQALVPYVP